MWKELAAQACHKLEDKEEVKDLIMDFTKAVKIEVKEERDNAKAKKEVGVIGQDEAGEECEEQAECKINKEESKGVEVEADKKSETE